MKKYIPYIIIVALIVALFLSIQRCNKEKSNAAVNYAALIDTTKHYTNKLGTQSATIKTLQLDRKQLNELMLDKDAKLKALASEFAKVNSVVKAETKIEIPKIWAKFDTPLPVNDTITVLPTGTVFTDWYSLSYQVKIDSLIIEPFNTWSDITVITGTKRKWFLGKETITTDVTANNPYLQVTQIKAAEVAVPNPWYKKWYVWLAAGAVGGFIISK